MSQKDEQFSCPLGHVVIAGFGPVGRAAAEACKNAGIEVVIIDLNLNTIQKQMAHNLRVVYGDVRDEEVLEAAGISGAAALILAVPDENMALEACAAARKMNQRIFIAARTNFLSKGMLASQAGADHVVVEEVVTAEAMKNAVVEHLCGKNTGA